MKAFMHVGFLIALSSLLLVATNAHADWLLTYDVAVSSSPSGPFKSSATIWTQNVVFPDTPSSIGLSASTYTGVELTQFGYAHPLATINAFAGSNLPNSVTKVPYFIKVTMHDPSSNQSGSLILNAVLNSEPFPYFFTSHTPGQTPFVQIGNYTYGVRILPLPEPGAVALPPAPPTGAGDLPPGGNGAGPEFTIFAEVERSWLTETPEPSSLIIACPCLLAGGLLVRGRCGWLLRKLV